MHPLITAPGEPYNEGRHQEEKAPQAMHGPRPTAATAAATGQRRDPARDVRHLD